MRLRLIRSFASKLDSLGQIVFMVGLALVLSMLAMFSLDRDPPFALVSYTATSVAPGGKLVIRGVVERDVGRQCTVTYTRRMVSAAGIKFWESPPTYYNSASLQKLEELSPHEIRIEVEVPYWAPVGEFEYITALDYVCNPLHYLWPIEVLMTIKSEVKEK